MLRKRRKKTAVQYALRTAQQCAVHRLQVQTLPNEAPPMGKIHTFSKMAVTFELLMGF